MPKELSLKKAHKPPPKNQKPITQFFKNTNGPATQREQNPPSESQNFETISEKSSVKRKASSPIKLAEIEILDNEVNVITTCLKDSKDIEITSKKFKSTHTTQHSSEKGTHNKISNQKENSFNTKSSPKKINDHSISQDLKLNEKIISEIDISRNGNRSPLTSIKNDNIIENDDKIDIEENNCSIYNINHNENYINNTKKVETPTKCSPLKNHEINDISFNDKRNKTPKKSPKVPTELRRSPRIANKTLQKSPKSELSTSKYSSVKTLEFNQHELDHVFGDMWEDDFNEEYIEDLDLSTMQRCEIIRAQKLHSTKLELRLKNANNNKGTCCIEGTWLSTPLTPGEIVSVIASKDSSGQFSVNNNSGLVVLRPDHLLSTTSVVAGVFCRRKAVLQERWRGMDPANKAMTIGVLTHELVQKALTKKIMSVEQISSEIDNILKDSIGRLYDTGLSIEETRSNMEAYISPLAEFMQKYVADKRRPIMRDKKDTWCGHIDKVLDIEENLYCPQLGLKGKIDATLEVTIHKNSQRAIVPLELKSGAASMSAEHRGQVIQYGMMLSLQQSGDPTGNLPEGLLLYLKDCIDLQSVSCAYREKRDLIMLRNQLVIHLAAGPQNTDPEQIPDIEDASHLLCQSLPEPVNNERACAKCPYLTLCSLHLWYTDGPTVTNKHPLTKLRGEALGHLTSEHIKYFLHWNTLIRMEEQQQKASPLHALWTESVEKRTKRGVCAGNLKLKSVEQMDDRFLHKFERKKEDCDALRENNKSIKGPQEGEFSIVSIDNRPWIAAGVISLANEKEIHIVLERDLRIRLNNGTLYHIDTYESASITINNLTNIGVLMDDTNNSQRLRRLIIDKDVPQFDSKLPRKVSHLAAKLMRSLNIEQQRAVLKALAAKDYALLQGLPGTGKTQTISVLIQMLVALKQRVIVTAHTHSAVDTVLNRLPESLRVMRLGSSVRVSASLTERCEQHLTSKCDTPEQLAELYNSMEVVGVTCLGSSHAMLAKTTFDMCIVDEATQVLQSTILRPLYAAKRFILVGDPEQLPPVVRSRAARGLGMEVSLFHRLANEDATCTLQLQYRMNQVLADMANKVAYNSRLKCANPEVAQARLNLNMEAITSLYATEAPWLLKACSPEPKYAALFLDMESNIDKKDTNKNKCTNADEACVVLALVNALKEGGVKSTDIGVIAPYRDQVSLLRCSLARQSVEVSTVDQFQGKDKSVIIYSCTRSDDGTEDNKIKEGEILNDQRRMAVSVTRAKHKLLVVGNSRCLLRYTPLQRLIDACMLVQLEQNTINHFLVKYRTLIS